jgi:hypothetical protein
VGKYFYSKIERDENDKLIQVVEVHDTDSGLNRKPDIRVLPYDVTVSRIKEEFDGTVRVKASKMEKNSKTGLLEFKEYEY